MSAPSASLADQQEPADSDDAASVRTPSDRCPHDGPADSADSAADSEPKSLSAPPPTDDLQKHRPADSTDGTDSDLQPISGLHLRCARCGQPMNPALTAAGHLAHPACTPAIPDAEGGTP
ncbi:hypothetical protein GCM10010324_01510 [Streptomyces hiroshimensis]|uniref:Uncharacterized protein n=1 Tax=Streptomyces hiroshimensis TaxID=66424 RepID=A0ABQ2Y319_9ACTN|nr:hypothetical protein GCM10010324_01510 [Streptomyces hiroshimensis]